jgi:hypothetical protein
LHAELPHALVLDDGELPDVRAALTAIGVRFADAVEGDGEREVPLLVTTAARAKALCETPATPRHHLHLVVAGPDDGSLIGVPCDFAIRRPVAASLLRLLAERAGYEGPERRRALRVAIGAPVLVRVGESSREAILAQVSASGCGLVASHSFETNARLVIGIPSELTAPRSLALPGRVLGARRTTTADGETWDISVAFDTLPLGDRVTLRALMAGQPIDFRPRGHAGVDEAGPTSRPRISLRRRRLGGARGGSRIVIGRGLSARGMRVERDPLLQDGDEIMLTLHGGSEAEPVTLPAAVRADAGGTHWFLAFSELEPQTLAALTRLRDSVAGFAAEAGAEDPPGCLVAEIRSR